jgi:hypothetical protein
LDEDGLASTGGTTERRLFFLNHNTPRRVLGTLLCAQDAWGVVGGAAVWTCGS